MTERGSVEPNGHGKAARPFVAVTFLTAGTAAPGLQLNGLNPLQVREALDRLADSRLRIIENAKAEPRFADAAYLVLSAPDGDQPIDHAASHRMSGYQIRAARHFLRVWSDAAILGFLQMSAQQQAKQPPSALLIPTH